MDEGGLGTEATFGSKPSSKNLNGQFGQRVRDYAVVAPTAERGFCKPVVGGANPSGSF